ncbi:hypothetical protein BC834DRAFT_362162 [Gloeopeniophorella convolvens]|nr:hypothetical protein BC834DRAFT_362162 [Gloeopeniophorella convolvens]
MRAVSTAIVLALAAQGLTAPLSAPLSAPLDPSDLTPDQVAAIKSAFRSTLGLAGRAPLVLPSNLSPEQISEIQSEFKNSLGLKVLKREIEARAPFVLSPGLSPEQIAAIQNQFKNAPAGLSFLKRTGVAGEAVEVAESGLKTALKTGALGGVGTLIGGELGKLFGGSDSSNSRRELEEFEELFARTGVAGEAVEVAESGLKTALKTGALGGLGTLIGGGLAKLFGGDDNSNSRRELEEFEELFARTGVAGEAVEAAESGLTTALKTGALGGLGTLIGGGLAKLFGGR